MKLSQYLIATVLMSLTLCTYSQKTATYQNPTNTLFEQGKTLYEAHKYAAAREVLSDFLKQSTEKNSANIVEAEYLHAMSAMHLDNKDATLLLDDFVEKYPDKSRTKHVHYKLGINNFSNGKYGDALQNFEKTDIASLSNEEIAAFYFKKGYSLYRMRRPDEAQVAFAEIKDAPNQYATQATYYYSHIAYEKKNYRTALEGFQSLKNDEKFGNLVSYYIVHIYYHQGESELLLQEALPLLSTINEARKPELSQLIGEAYYRLSDYENATQHLEYYQTNTQKRVSRENQYQLGFTYFQNKDYEKGLEKFQESIQNNKDTLAQNAYYHLGMCYIELEKPQFAGNAFHSAYKIPGNESLREDALYNYVKLSYESPYGPYNKAADAVKKYLNEYPNSKHMDEINSFLVDIFLSSKDYASAVNAFEQIDLKTDRLKRAYQKVSFYYAIELYNQEDYFNAIKYFKESIKYDYDKKIKAQSRFWVADSYYQYKNYDLAFEYFDKFLVTDGAYSLEIFPTAYYNQGYILFSQKDYDGARNAFRKYTIGERFRKQELLADAFIRLGDCYFIDKDYTQAIGYYDKAIELKAPDTDYAIYQKALAYGGQGNFPNKILQLDALLRTQSESAFRDDATYEMALTYLIQNNEREALKRFSEVYTNYPHSVFAKKSFLKSGLLHYNLDNNEEALKMLKNVAEKYPNTPDANEALASIKNIYIDMNQVDAYFDYAKNLNYATITATEQDSATYISAENLYMQGDCEKSSEGFSKYLDIYPDGSFAINAHFYLGQCAHKAKSYDVALTHFEYVAEQGQTQFTETALSKAGKILYTNENYKKALDYFEQLEKIAEYDENRVMAQEGLLRTHYHMENYKKAIRAAEKLLMDYDIPEKTKTEAHLIVGRSAVVLNDMNLAKGEFQTIMNASNKAFAAEANYNLAKIDFLNGEYEQAENRIFEISEKYGNQNDWLAKSFVLLGEVYINTGNLFQAKQTLQSIIDNYDGKELVDEAKQKIYDIIQLEQIQEQQKIEQEKQAEKDEQDVENY